MIIEPLFRVAARTWSAGRVRSGRGMAHLDTLRFLLTSAADTRYGKAHGFAEILKAPDLYEAFARRVPVIDYQAWVDFLGPLNPNNGVRPLRNIAWPGTIDVFCMSSGTSSGRTKYIPYSPAMRRVNQTAALDMYAHMVRAHPEIAPPLNRSLYMTGSTNVGKNEYGAVCGDMSGLTRYLAPRGYDLITLPPRAVASIEPWSARLEALVALCASGARISAFFGIPIWQKALLETVAAHTGKPIGEVLPHLRYLVHGGMSIAPYRTRLAELVGDRVSFIEIYAASETGITAFSLPGETGMRFWETYRVFYEFEAADGTICLSDQVQAGKPYQLLISSPSGLFRYRIGDVVVFRSVTPLVLDYVMRDKTTSAFDEKVTENELVTAMSEADPAIADFSVGPDIAGRRHVWFLICDEVPKGDWLTRLDNLLRARNLDYDDYRGDGRIHAPTAVAVRDRAAYLTRLKREEGGQRKFPRLLTPDETAALLAHYTSQG